jgi:hypothetical protein
VVENFSFLQGSCISTNGGGAIHVFLRKIERRMTYGNAISQFPTIHSASSCIKLLKVIGFGTWLKYFMTGATSDCQS